MAGFCAFPPRKSVYNVFMVVFSAFKGNMYNEWDKCTCVGNGEVQSYLEHHEMIGKAIFFEVVGRYFFWISPGPFFGSPTTTSKKKRGQNPPQSVTPFLGDSIRQLCSHLIVSFVIDLLSTVLLFILAQSDSF